MSLIVDWLAFLAGGSAGAGDKLTAEAKASSSLTARFVSVGVDGDVVVIEKRLDRDGDSDALTGRVSASEDTRDADVLVETRLPGRKPSANLGSSGGRSSRGGEETEMEGAFSSETGQTSWSAGLGGRKCAASVGKGDLE
jgi:hypothetical protein